MNIQTAGQREYYQRPADERWSDPVAYLAHCQAVKAESRERVYAAADLRVVESAGDGLQLQSPRGVASFSHWSFGQLAASVGAPAGYLRELPEPLGAACLNHGLRELPAGTDLQLLARQIPGQPVPMLRACTSRTYTRIWDADLWGGVLDQIVGHQSRVTPSAQWQVPPAWPGSPPSGLYAGDRDSFLLLVDGGSIVPDPSVRGGDGSGQLWRGIMGRNSETGASGVWLLDFTLRSVCGNHLISLGQKISTFYRRHVSEAALRDTIREVARLAQTVAQRSEAADLALIRWMMAHELAQTKAGIVSELRAAGMTQAAAAAAYQLAEVHEHSPHSYWGVVNGITRASQALTDGHQDDRLELDRIAAALSRRALVAAA